MIPHTRPVIGRDLEDVRIAHGVSTADACWMFGMSPTKWTHVARQGANDPVSPTLALLVRVLNEYPQLRLIPRMPDAQEMMELVNSVTHIDKKRFSIMAGSEGSGGYRWLTLGARQTPLMQRLFFCLRHAIMMQPDASRQDVINAWDKMVDTEARARGVDDVYRQGYWSPRPDKTPGKVARETKRVKAKAKTQR